MMQVPLNAPTFGNEEIEAAIAVLRSGQVTMSGNCLKFEQEFERTLSTANAVFVNSGSSANLLAFFALTNPMCPTIPNKKKVTPGSEVIVPAVTWSTTIWPIVQAGLIPVLVDADPLTLQMNPDAVSKAISEKTVAICPVHVLGNAVNMKAIQEIATAHKLWLIEDTCEALGTKYDGQYVGTIGDIGTYSFFFSHHITTIEGGMVITPHDELAELFRSMRAHGWTRHLKNRDAAEKKHAEIDPRFLFITTGFNLRPTEINGVFGIHQIRKLETLNAARVQIAKRWAEDFHDLSETKKLRPMQVTENVSCTWFGFPVICESIIERKKLQTHLETNGIETRPIICGNLARQPAFKHIPHRISGTLHGADQIMDHGLFWGSHPSMTSEEINYVSKTVRSYFK